MFRKMCNHAAIEAELEPVGPILVRSGKQAHDPMRPDVSAVRTFHTRGETVYLPGAGLKGVMRAHGERILRAEGKRVCDVFADDSACRRREEADAPTIFRNSCPACRTFGSTRVAGRLRVGDAYPTEATWAEANRSEIRNGVGITRDKQSAAPGVLYDMEVVTRGRFAMRIDLEDFELWQLALAVQVLADLDTGLIQVGGMKSRGLGTVRVVKASLFYEATGVTGALRGAAAWFGEDAAAWGLAKEPEVAAVGAWRASGLRQRCEFPDREALFGLLDQLSRTVWPQFVARR